MSSRLVPESVEAFAQRLCDLKAHRESDKDGTRPTRPTRRRLSAKQRQLVFEKTGGRCHICGGEITGSWHADHVMAHSRAGEHTVDNYLPAHPLCNNYRWDYLPEEFQLILKLGVWARTQIEIGSSRGKTIADGFLRYEQARLRRRKDPGTS